ncbi:MAG: hypothetical protein CMI54_07140 [Parcubacteria group bacterium]|jgi:hypothetical protein|nr:hypothetical protein [Parcubacteria group bacterium]|tara:strand:- start:34767 stop:34985 length:219 start_codon:yes stop_codon:yes gene_type:complete
MKIKNKFTGEIKDFEYDFMGKAEAKRLINTGQWKKVKDSTAMGGLGSPGYGSLSQGFGSFDDDDEDEDDWGY